MGFKQELQKRIDRKQQEIRELEDTIRQSYAYLQGLQDTLKMVPKEDAMEREAVLRQGSAVALARDALRSRGVPMHVSEILTAIKKPDTKANRLALGGSMAAYVRKESVFTRPEPNTFGLIEFDRDKELETDLEAVKIAAGEMMSGGHKIKAAS